MGRPRITLQEWCENDKKQKIDFFKAESRRENGLLDFNYTHNTYFSRQAGSFMPPITLVTMKGSNVSLVLHITVECFEQLKNRYKSITKAERDRNLVKKQYSFKPAIANQIKKMKEDAGFAREETIIENLINEKINKNTEYKAKEKIQTKEINFKILNNTLNNNFKDILNLNITKDNLQHKVDKLTDLLARAYLMNDHYKDLLKENSIDISPPNINEITVQEKIEEVKEIIKPSF